MAVMTHPQRLDTVHRLAGAIQDRSRSSSIRNRTVRRTHCVPKGIKCCG
jgi:hypothetical protein